MDTLIILERIFDFIKCVFRRLIKIFINYFFKRHYIFSYSELFTNMIFFRFEGDHPNNRNLWTFWEICIDKLEDKQDLFFHHLKLYIDRLVERKVHDFSEYEIARFENRYDNKFVIIEGICKNCTNEYEYFNIPVMLYLKGYFFKDSRILSDYVETTACKNCKNCQYEFQNLMPVID